MGGADKFNLDVVEHLTKRGWEITITTTLRSDHSWFPLFARWTPDIFILHHFLRPGDYPRFLRYLIQSRQIETVLLSHSEFGYRLLPYLRASCPQVSFLDFCHIEEEFWKNGGYPRMAVECQDLLDVNIVSSEHLRRWMVQQGANPQCVRVCYTNIDPDQWRPLAPDQRPVIRQELQLAEEVPIILYAGRICKQKQPRVFAQTILRLVRTSHPVVALVAGDGPELAWLRSFVTREGLKDYIHLLGAVTSPRMQQLMAAADVFFLPSLWEGIALAIYEAMASGLPVVGADVGGQRELVTPECGVLVARSDEETEASQYADVLLELLSHAARRKEMGQAGRRRVEAHFRLDQMVERLLVFLQEAAQRHVSRPCTALELGRERLFAVQAVIIQDQEQCIQEQERYIQSLARHKAWLEHERETWRRLAEEREQMLREQQQWSQELEKGKAWLEEQWVNWQRLAGEREQIIQRQERVIQEWKRNFWGRVSMRLGMLRPPHVIQNELSQETDR
jgi:glycosyltransferase involved in cell wall biosynthesis